MTLEALAARTHHAVFRGYDIFKEYDNAKACCTNLLYFYSTHSSKKLVMVDLIQNAHTLFEEFPPLSSTVPLRHVPETMSPDTHLSLLFLSRDLAPQEASTRPAPALHSVAEWRSHQSRRPPHPDAATMPPSPPRSVLSSSMSDFPFSSATSLQTRMGGFSS